MLKKLLFTLSTFLVTFAVFVNGAYAAVNVNTANEAVLQSVKGIGPARAKAIVDERDKNGLYKDAADLASRIKGISTKSVEKLQQEGLSVDATATSTAAPATSAAATPTPSQASAAAEK